MIYSKTTAKEKELVMIRDSKRVSTSLNVDPILYKEFKMEALRRDMEISDLLDYAMRLVIQEGKNKRTNNEGGNNIK
jgi:hypothetical protein